MKRRKFISLGLAGSVAASLPLAYCGISHSHDEPAFLFSIMPSSLIRQIGQAYLEQVPSEADSKKLLALIGADSQSPPAIKIQDDFKKGNTVVVEGWIISVTEARQSALNYLNS